MGHTLGLALQGRFNDPVPLVLRIVHFAPATRSDLPDLPDALLVHTLAPKLHRGPAHAESLGDRYILLTRHRSQDNSAAQRHLLRRPVRGFPLFQLCALRRLQLDLQTFVRHDWDHTKHWNYVKLFMGHYTSLAGPFGSCADTFACAKDTAAQMAPTPASTSSIPSALLN